MSCQQVFIVVAKSIWGYIFQVANVEPDRSLTEDSQECLKSNVVTSKPVDSHDMHVVEAINCVIGQQLLPA